MSRIISMVLLLLTGAGALFGGFLLITDPEGNSIGLPSAWIQESIFSSYLIPGLFLFVVFGAGSIIIASLTFLRSDIAPLLTMLIGTALIIWIVIQFIVIQHFSFLQIIISGTGVVLLLLGFNEKIHSGKVDRPHT